MDLLFTYIVPLASVTALFICWRLWALMSITTKSKIAFFIRKVLVYTVVIRRRSTSSDTTTYGALNILLFLTANLTACLFKLSDIRHLAERCGMLLMINLVPLFLGGRTNLFIDRILRLSLDDYTLMHRWLGRVCVLLGLVHGIVNSVTSSSSTSETILLSILASLGVLSFIYIRRLKYEVFIKTHLMLALVLIGFLWFHVCFYKSKAVICLGIATGLWSLQHIVWFARLIYRNPTPSTSNVAFRHHQGPAQAAELTIQLEKPWDVSPGQYVYLTFPSLARNRAGFIQTHPYVVAWVDGSDITVLIQRLKGFSDALFASKGSRYRTVVDGPYGSYQSVENYDKVLFMASGIGIAAHLLAIKHLLASHNDCKARVRRITLVWFLETTEQEMWAQGFLDKLIETDDRDIFTSATFTPGVIANGDSVARYTYDINGASSIRRRHIRTNKPLDVSWYIEQESKLEAGNMICVDLQDSKKLSGMV
ncbi:hypothetical protein DM02DRAFT_665049 [Periconia macrospinosa]|uniref:ferric-chelate reductase (NADPH) n=1 Tax=Periconia macrospinosa TaxID=97972 RepID=A0A2V1CZ40_9PLEO|nr:hypothetical protein DM02DRAFT_665049 [Periconia macrospinosa]